MLNRLSLQKTGEFWKFTSEEALEDYLYDSLDILDLKPLSRQLSVDGQFCDIIAIDQSNRITILELKNTEDRYVVQQLSRYHYALTHEKPYSDVADYDSPISLVTLAPHFHKDNFIDRLYHKLEIKFLRFNIVQKHQKLFLCIEEFKDTQWRDFIENEIPYKQEWISEQNPIRIATKTIPPPPKSFTSILKENKETKDKIYQKEIFEQWEKLAQIRELILSFDERISEHPQITYDSRMFRYGLRKSTGKEIRPNRCCAQIYYKRPKSSRYSYDPFKFYLWLPVPIEESNLKIPIERVRILGYEEKARIQVDGRSPNASYWAKRNTEQYLQDYSALVDREWEHSFDTFLNIALEQWLSQIQNTTYLSEL